MPPSSSQSWQSPLSNTFSIPSPVYARLALLSLAFFSPRNVIAELRCALDDLLEQLVDRAVARRGDADPLAGVDEPRDQASRGVRLARARRALDHEVPAVEREQELGQLLHLVRLHVAVERLAAEHRLDRRIAAVAREQRARRSARALPPAPSCCTGRPGAAPRAAARLRSSGRASARARARRGRG